jgi:spermidine/putrescine transport system permease protein
MKKIRKLIADGYLGLVLAFLYLPILVIIVFSFSNSSNFSFSQGFSFGSYISMFTSNKAPLLLRALKNTLIIAACASVLSTIIGTLSAVGIHYLQNGTKKAVLGLNQLPIVNSEIVMAVSLMVFFVSIKIIPEGLPRLIIAHTVFCTPYVVLSVMPRFVQMNPNLYEAALDLGANPIQAMTKVVVPYIMPGVISGFVMAFTLSMDDFIITQINKGSTGIETLSTFIYQDMQKQGLEPFWYAVFSIFFIVVLTVLLFVNLRKTKGETK